MSVYPLTMSRYISLVALLWSSFDDLYIRQGATTTGPCNIFSVYWEIHSEDPTSFLAVDHTLMWDLKNGTSGLLLLDQSNTITLMHNNMSSVWAFNRNYPSYVKNVDSSHSSSIDVLLNLSRDAQNPEKNYFSMYLNKENFCAEKTVHLLEDQVLTLAIVASDWFPVGVTRSFATQLEVVWNADYLVGDESFVTLVLYDVNGTLLETLSSSGTVYTFAALIPCTEYRICLSTEETHNLVCITGLTDPLPPTNFTVLRANSSSVTVYWDKPALGKYMSFCLEAHVIQPIVTLQPTLKKFTLMQHGKEFTILGLPSCQKVNISAWTVCESYERKPSRTIFAITVTGPNETIRVAHKRTSDGVSLSWTEPSMYHFVHIFVGEKLHGSTRKSRYLVTGLPSCTENEFKLEALCGKSSSGIATIRDYTGPGSISEMKLQMDHNGVVLVVTWKSLSRSNATFGYILHDTTNQSTEVGEVSTTAILLMNQRNNTEYHLKVFEKCQGELGEPSSIKFALYSIETHEDKFPFSAVRRVPALTAWTPTNYSAELHHKTQQTSVDAVKSIVQKLLSKCPRVKAVSSDISTQSTTIKVCLTVSFENVTWAPNTSWTGCFNLKDEEYPSTGIICGSVLGPTPVSANQDEVPTKQDAISTERRNVGTTMKAAKNEIMEYSRIHLNGDEMQQVLPTLGKENYSGSEISVFCNLEFMKVNVSKAYLQRKIKQQAKLLLNDGSCQDENTDGDYYEFTVLFEFPFCGGQMLVNESHITFQHQLQNTYEPGTYITRSDFTLIWQCFYVRDTILTIHDGPFSSTRSLIRKMVKSGIKALRFSKKVLLLYVITLYMDDSFLPSSAVNGSVTFGLSEKLYIEVKADIIDKNFNKTFLLKVVSCWATMTPDPDEGQTYYFLQNGCPVDPSFKWHTPKDAVAISRFSIQMFVFASMRESPIFIHCSSKICSSEKPEDCLTCTDIQLQQYVELLDRFLFSSLEQR
ncbi:uncharacterized protein [Ambystoma mexicanum]|uniref:uncharacterized protein isoform X2 n=1 Tax=Ambystoma mexicanum TaxID=8296 RepID=UPI0037E7800B